MSNFRVGQKVLCVHSTVRRVNDRGLPGFVKGQVLTVSDIFLHDGFGLLPEKQAFLRFVETGWDVAGHHSAFRPLVERKTDISIFRAMLNNSKVGQPA